MSAAPRRSTFETKALVAFAVLVVVVWIARPDEIERDGTTRRHPPSVFYAGDGGAKAMSLAVGELGFDARSWMQPFPDRADSDEPRCLIVLAPTEPLRTSEAVWLRRWLRKGGRLIYAPAAQGEDEFLKLLGLGSTPLPDISATPAQPESEEARRWLEGTHGTITGFRATIDVPPSGPKSDRSEVLLASGSRSTAALLVTFCEGRALVLADATPLTNDWLRKSGLASFALRAIADFGEGGTVWFDEFHHGFDDRAGIEHAFIRFLTSSSMGWASIQLAVIAFAAAAFAGVPMGRPIPPPAPTPRSPLEHVDALAAAYRAAGAVRRPASILLDGLRLRLRVTSPAQLAERIATLAQSDPGVRGAANALVEDPRGSRNPPDLVHFANAIDRILSSERARAASE